MDTVTISRFLSSAHLWTVSDFELRSVCPEWPAQRFLKTPWICFILSFFAFFAHLASLSSIQVPSELGQINGIRAVDAGMFPSDRFLKDRSIHLSPHVKQRPWMIGDNSSTLSSLPPAKIL